MLDIGALLRDRTTEAPVSPPVLSAVAYLLRHYSAPVMLRDLARLTGRNTFQLIRAFRKELGITPHALLVRIRVHQATALLALGEPIAGAAADVGFVDQTYFGRHFKRIHHVTPRRYMAALRGGVPSAPAIGVH